MNTIDAHTWASTVCPSVYGRNGDDSRALTQVRDLIAEHFASIEGRDVQDYDATAYELASMLDRSGLLVEARTDPRFSALIAQAEEKP